MTEGSGGEEPRANESRRKADEADAGREGGPGEGSHWWSSPFGELQEMMEDLVEGFRGVSPAVHARYPRLEMVETGDAYDVWLDVPGVEREDLKVSALGDELTVHGLRRRPEYPESANVRRSERSYGRFRRVLRLPADVDAEGIRAKLETGVLRVTLPRRVEAEGRTIDVETDG